VNAVGGQLGASGGELPASVPFCSVADVKTEYSEDLSESATSVASSSTNVLVNVNDVLQLPEKASNLPSPPAAVVSDSPAISSSSSSAAAAEAAVSELASELNHHEHRSELASELITATDDSQSVQQESVRTAADTDVIDSPSASVHTSPRTALDTGAIDSALSSVHTSLSLRDKQQPADSDIQGLFLLFLLSYFIFLIFL